MVNQNDDTPDAARPPNLNDLLGLCRELNARGAKYLVIGGMAVIQHGFVRATEDIDLLVEVSVDNFSRIRDAMLTLPDRAIREVEPDDLDKYVVVRVGDEFVVDLMKSACGVEYAEASKQVSLSTIEGVLIPFANPQLLLRMKQTYREKDAMDRMFLENLLKSNDPPKGS
jgi:hypothetical protein